MARERGDPTQAHAYFKQSLLLSRQIGNARFAGRCLAALAERDGVRVLLVILDGSDRWWDAAAMIERAFSWR
jgi:hypothetical protein